MSRVNEWFGKKFKELSDKEKHEYWSRVAKLRYKPSEKQREWQEMCINLAQRREELELAKKIRPLENIKAKIMQLNIETTYLQEIEKIINYEIERLKGEKCE